MEGTLFRPSEQASSHTQIPSTTSNWEALDICTYTPSLNKVEHAIRKLKNNKAAGRDEITAEMLKHGGDLVLKIVTHPHGKDIGN